MEGNHCPNPPLLPSPDTENNNREDPGNPCLIKAPSQGRDQRQRTLPRPGETSLHAKILCTPDQHLFLFQRPQPDLLPPPPAAPRFVHLDDDRHFRVRSRPAASADPAPLRFCLPCELLFDGLDALRAHLVALHPHLPLPSDEPGSLMIQSGQTLSFLHPSDDTTSSEAASSEELARSLLVASELSASRLLRQVTQQSLGLTSPIPAPAEQLSRTPLSSPHSSLASTTRNSCKTLKCPKCNWHYKYQETLEIHMKEKHPETEVSCVFCLHSQPHPKLARGESYSCGYKPYRCDVCKYSTTTKGNLSIHMQSDKHLNNVQELQQGIEPSPPTPNPQSSPEASSSLYRCDPCNYETTVARNLRIHMTSDKHSQNALLLQQKMGAPDGTTIPMEPGFPFGLESMGRSLGKTFQCCVCIVFDTDSVEEAIRHAEAERVEPGGGDVSTFSGHHFCNLCQYKTHLKANFQLHTKTDKHVQRQAMVNHVREGGAGNEWRLAYLSPNNPVQLRCNLCNEFFTSTAKLRSHSLSPPHRCLDAALRQSPNCPLCHFQSADREAMLRHLESGEHAEEAKGLAPDSMADAIHCCAWCNFTSKTGSQIDDHVRQQHGDGPLDSDGDDLPLPCPLCQAECGPGRASLETHLSQEHNVPAERIQRLLTVLPSATTSPPASVPADSTVDSDAEASEDEPRCHACAVPFSSQQELGRHLSESGHLEQQETPNGPGYYCWEQGCDQFFSAISAVLAHFREEHSDQRKSCVSDRHVYRFRCGECSLAFRTEAKLQTHSLYHLMRASTRCAICQRTFRSIEALRAHVEKSHVGADSPEPSRREIESKPFVPQTRSLIPRKSEKAGAAGGVDKFLDPGRPFKCEICRESFTQKNILVVHLNSVSHLHRVKKLLEQQTPNIALTPELLSALSKGQPLASGREEEEPSTSKNHKCNVCKVAYSQGSTLDIHLRSVGHQSKLLKIPELLASGELSFPLVEQPDSAGSEGDFLAASLQQQLQLHLQSSAAALMANMWMGPLFQALQQSPNNPLGMFSCEKCNSIFASDSALQEHSRTVCDGRAEAPDDSVHSDSRRAAPGGGPMFKKLLQIYGWEIVMQFNETLRQRKRKLEQDPAELAVKLAKQDLPEVGEFACTDCDKIFSSIWVLKAHHEQFHNQDPVPSDEIEKLSAELKGAMERKQEEAEAPKPQQAVVSSSDRVKQEEPSEEKSPVANEAVHTTTTTTASKTQPNIHPALAAMMGGGAGTGFPMMSGGFPGPFPSFNPFLPFPVSAMDMPDMMSGMPDFLNNQAQQSMIRSLPPQSNMSSQQKRARTRITDDQLKILREYFDINNSPSEQQIEEMSRKSGLPQKVIKHWFRNTLFKERQKNKDSPYNFSIPPSLGIDLEEYEKTGETRVIQFKPEAAASPLPAKEEAPAPVHLPAETPSASQILSAQETLRRLSALPTHLPPFNILSQLRPEDEAKLEQRRGEMSETSPGASGAGGRRANRTRFTDHQLKTLQEFFEKQAYPKDDDLERLSKQLQLSPRVIVVWFQNARQKARKVYENLPHSGGNSERFTKTPGCNFQCKGCSLVFQRYYELIQHQQKHCFKDKELPDDIHSASSTPGKEYYDDPPKSEPDLTAKPARKSVKTESFNKRCPFCGILIYSVSSMESHLESKHAEQCTKTIVNIDLLPDAEEVPTITTSSASVEEAAPNTGNGFKYAFNPKSSDERPISQFSNSGSPNNISFTHSDNEDSQSTFSQDSPSPHFSINPGPAAGLLGGYSRPPAKRYRTHLSPLQVHIMKYLFHDYKTPSMAECELLGTTVGLHKRVVQVWFQNARAKERKAKAALGQDPKLDEARPAPLRCDLCAYTYSSKHTVQDHVFTKEHIGKLRDSLKDSVDASVSPSPLRHSPQPPRSAPLAPPPSTTAHSNIPAYTTDPAAYYANLAASTMLYSSGFGGMPGASGFYDPNLHGTPVPMLQIPAPVAKRIAESMSAGGTSCRFTQDGKTFAQVVASIDPQRQFLVEKDLVVGYGCKKCCTAFQSEELVQNHFRNVCQSLGPPFNLIQTHYECRRCSESFGTQAELQAHVGASKHRGKMG